MATDNAFPSLPELQQRGFQALQLIDWCRGIAKSAAETLREQDDDTEGCLQAIAHLLDEASDHVSLLEQFIADLPAEEG